jgi:Ca2+-binding RTX toxin-like protein
MLVLLSFVLNASADLCPGGYPKRCGNGTGYITYDYGTDACSFWVEEDGAVSVTIIGGTSGWAAIVDAPSGDFCCASNDTVMPSAARNGLAYFGISAKDYSGPLTADLQAVDIAGTDRSTWVWGSEGDDTIIGSDDTGPTYGDVIHGGDGSDYIDGGAGTDNLHGDDDDEYNDSDRIWGGTGADTIDVGWYGCNNQAFGGDGNDTITGSGNFGCTTADHLEGGAGIDTINAGGGNDEVCGHGGVDTLNGEGGDDSMYGGAEIDVVDGGTGTNSCDVTAGPDSYTNCTNLITAYCPVPPAWP